MHSFEHKNDVEKRVLPMSCGALEWGPKHKPSLTLDIAVYTQRIGAGQYLRISWSAPLRLVNI